MCREVNGWRNHETYSAVLWLQTDFYRTTEGLKRNAKNWIALSDSLKDLFQNLKVCVLENPNQDALRVLLDIGSIQNVDFDQIAQRFLEVEI